MCRREEFAKHNSRIGQRIRSMRPTWLIVITSNIFHLLQHRNFFSNNLLQFFSSIRQTKEKKKKTTYLHREIAFHFFFFALLWFSSSLGSCVRSESHSLVSRTGVLNLRSCYVHHPYSYVWFGWNKSEAENPKLIKC